MPTAASDSEVKVSAWGAMATATPRDRRNMQRVGLALVCWGVAFVASTVLLDGGALEGVAAWIAAAVPGGMAVVAVRRYVVFLREADELLRQIHLEGLALGFGAGFLFMTTWRLLERAGAFELDVNDPVMVMMLFWGIGQWLAARRYS